MRHLADVNVSADTMRASIRTFLKRLFSLIGGFHDDLILMVKPLKSSSVLVVVVLVLILALVLVLSALNLVLETVRILLKLSQCPVPVMVQCPVPVMVQSVLFL